MKKRLMIGLTSGLLVAAMTGATGPASAAPPRFLGTIICLNNGGGANSYFLFGIDPDGLTKKELNRLKRAETGSADDQCVRRTWDDSGVFRV